MDFFKKKAKNTSNQKMEKNKRASKLEKGDCIETLFVILIGIICADILSDY
jgi:hypothetical protein